MKTREGRRLARRPPGKGLIYLDGTGNGFAVTVLAVSNSTARLRQHFPFLAPDSFTLTSTPAGSEASVPVRCEKLSQSGDIIRVRFSSPYPGFRP